MDLDLARIARRTLIGATAVFALVHVYLFARGANYAPDFHWGLFPAARGLLAGRSPYPPADPGYLFRFEHAYVTPPLIAILAVPFTVLPYRVALVCWNVACVCALALALRLLGVRDRRLYVLALISIPLTDSLEMGQPDALLALLAAFAWRYREAAAGALALGALIAAKLLAAPLLVWLLVTRRVRSFALACASAALLLLGSWALIGFQGLLAYPKLLAADARAFEAWRESGSVAGAVIDLGAGRHAAHWIALAISAAVAGSIVRIARNRDFGWFAGMLVFGLLASPIMWPHYLLVLLVPLAIAGGRGIGFWVPSCGLWLATIASRGAGGETRSLLFAGCAIAMGLGAALEGVLGRRTKPLACENTRQAEPWSSPHPSFGPSAATPDLSAVT